MFGNNKIEPIEKINAEKIEDAISDWPDSYYLEKEAVNRLGILEEVIERKLPSYEEDIIRKDLWNRRYEPANNEIENFCYDRYMRTYFNFRHLAVRTGRFSSSSKKIKEIKKELTDMGYLNDDGNMTDHTQLVHAEIMHMAKYYIDLSINDKQYTSVLWGFGTKKKHDVYKKIGREFYEATDLISNRFDIRELLTIWNDALLTAFKESIPNWSGILEELSKEYS